MADIEVANLLKLEIDGISDTLMFHKFSPPTLNLENITHNTWDDTGNLLPHSGGGKNPISGDWEIERAVDDQAALFQWFKDTHDKGRSDPSTKKDCKIYHLKLDGSILKTWSFQKTSILSYTCSAVDANANALLTESVKLHSEDIDIT
jgi:phage tail-like protein